MEVRVDIDGRPRLCGIAHGRHSLLLELKGLGDGQVVLRRAGRRAAKGLGALDVLRAGGGDGREEDEGLDLHGEVTWGR